MTSKTVYAVVSATDTLKRPYPFVRVEADGSVRELHQAERGYLETAFAPFDSGRPYVKTNYLQKDGWGSIEGFCPRVAVPPDTIIAAAPERDPNPPRSKAEEIEWLKSKMDGFEITEQPDGSVLMKRVPK